MPRARAILADLLLIATGYAAILKIAPLKLSSESPDSPRGPVQYKDSTCGLAISQASDAAVWRWQVYTR